MKYQTLEPKRATKARLRPEHPPANQPPAPAGAHHLQRTIGNQAVQHLFRSNQLPIQRKIHARYERMWAWAKDKGLLSDEAVDEIRLHVAPLTGAADTAILNLISLSNWANKAFKNDEDKRQAQALIWKKLHETDWDLNAASIVREQVKNAPVFVTPDNDIEVRDQIRDVFPGNLDKQLIEALWTNSINLFQKQQLASLLFNKGALRMETLNYLLEAIDPKHRYGMMHFLRQWFNENHTNTPFFEWVEAQEGIPDQSVAYLSKNERRNYQLKVGGTIHKGDGGLLVGRNIFVMTDSKKFYSTKKETGRLHHSTFLAGQKVRGAGELITNEAGKLEEITDYSGHYQPNKAEMQDVIRVLQSSGVNIHKVMYVNTTGEAPTMKASKFLTK